MEDDDLAAALATLGLTGHEARVYAALVDRSPASASFVAKTTGISRSSVYTTLDGLVAKGLVGTTHRNEVKQFAAAGHEALMDLLLGERERASARVATAQALRERFERGGAQDASVPRIVFFEGRRGLRRIYLQMLREARGPGPMLILRDEFVWRPEWAFVHEDEWRRRVARLKARTGLKTRLLVNGSALERERSHDYSGRRATAVRYLPRSVRFERFAVYVLDDVVSLLGFDDRALVGVRIANRALSVGVRTVFEALWATASADAPIQ